MTLEEQLAALIEDHNLSTLSISMTRLTDGRFFYSANAHGPDVNGIGKCALSPLNLSSLKDAAGAAIGTLNEKRAVGCIQIGELATMEDAKGGEA